MDRVGARIILDVPFEFKWPMCPLKLVSRSGFQMGLYPGELVESLVIPVNVRKSCTKGDTSSCGSAASVI